jgi:hypothetical protein
MLQEIIKQLEVLIRQTEAQKIAAYNTAYRQINEAVALKCKEIRFYG